MFKYVIITSSSDFLLYGSELFLNLSESVDITIDTNFMETYDDRINYYQDYIKILIDKDNFSNHTYTLLQNDKKKIVSANFTNNFIVK